MARDDQPEGGSPAQPSQIAGIFRTLGTYAITDADLAEAGIHDEKRRAPLRRMAASGNVLATVGAYAALKLRGRFDSVLISPEGVVAVYAERHKDGRAGEVFLFVEAKPPADARESVLAELREIVAEDITYGRTDIRVVAVGAGRIGEQAPEPGVVSPADEFVAEVKAVLDDVNDKYRTDGYAADARMTEFKIASAPHVPEVFEFKRPDGVQRDLPNLDLT